MGWTEYCVWITFFYFLFIDFVNILFVYFMIEMDMRYKMR